MTECRTKKESISWKIDQEEEEKPKRFSRSARWLGEFRSGAAMIFVGGKDMNK